MVKYRPVVERVELRLTETDAVGVNDPALRLQVVPVDGLDLDNLAHLLGPQLIGRRHAVFNDKQQGRAAIEA